jgi:hypothetical protein
MSISAMRLRQNEYGQRETSLERETLAAIRQDCAESLNLLCEMICIAIVSGFRDHRSSIGVEFRRALA